MMTFNDMLLLLLLLLEYNYNKDTLNINDLLYILIDESLVTTKYHNHIKGVSFNDYLVQSFDE